MVTAVGKDVADFAVGDEVLGTVATGSGGFAEHTVLPAAGTAKKPAAVETGHARGKVVIQVR